MESGWVLEGERKRTETRGMDLILEGNSERGAHKILISVI